MSVDPYMRGRMNAAKSYAAPYEVGEALYGGAVGEVVASNAEGLAAGDTVLHQLGWREHALLQGKHARKVDASGVPASAFLATAVISDRVRPGLIASTKGHWLKNVRGGANVNATVEERDADMGGGAIFHDNRVEVEGVTGGGPRERAARPLARRSARPDRPQPAAALPAHEDGLARTE